MYGFTNILYGTWVASNLVVNGALTGPLWCERTNRQVNVRDFIEIWQGTVERSLATRTSAGTNAPHAVSNVWYTWEQDTALPSNVYWLAQSGTNPPAQQRYLTRTATNWDVYAWTDRVNQVFGVPPPAIASTWELRDTNRFVWGAWSSVTVTNSMYAAYDGVYPFAFRTNGVFGQSAAGGPFATIRAMVDVYTNPAGSAFYDYGPIHGSHGHVPEWFNPEWDFPVAYLLDRILSLPDLPWGAHFKADTDCIRYSPGNWQDYTHMTATPGPVRTNAIREANITRWLTITNAIGRAIAAGLRQDPALAGTHMYAAILSNSTALAAGAASGYLDTTLATDGQYIGFTNLPMQSATCLWTRLAIGTNPAALAWGSNVLNHVVETNDYVEPYRVLAALTQTLRDDPAWVPPAAGAYNQVTWSSGKCATWAAAVADIANSIATSTVTGAPMCATWGTYDDNTLEPPYQAHAIVRTACLVLTGICEQVVCDIDWYAKSTNYHAGTWASNGFPVANGTYQRFAAAAGQSVFAVTSAALGSLSIPVEWCAEPTINSPDWWSGSYEGWLHREDKGFETIDQAAVLTWHFFYCTNGW